MIYSRRNILKALQAVILIIIINVFAGSTLNAQEPPPRPIRINPTAQILSFGAFYHGALGGTVSIEPSGDRTSTGDIVLLGMGYAYSPAMFEVNAHPGTVISILNGPPVTLTGSNGGSLQLSLGSTIPGPQFVSNVKFNIAIPLYVGGIITVVGGPIANPPGTYNGSFYITLVRE